MSDLPPGLSRPAMRAFEKEGLTRLRNFTEWSEKELLALHGVGPKAIRILREAMEPADLAFRPE